MTVQLARRPRQLIIPACDVYPNDRLMKVEKDELDRFFSLMKVGSIRQLLLKDACFNLVDNYLLAVVFVYFKRARLNSRREYTVDNFWLCLYLAHDMEEDEEELKWELLPWALGKDWIRHYAKFSFKKTELWKRMNYKSLVSRRQCNQIMMLSSYSALWNRQRSEDHSGAVRRPPGEYRPSGAGVSPPCFRCKNESIDTPDLNQDVEDHFYVYNGMDVNEGDSSDNDSGIMEVE